ncbi:EF-hand domain-containing protein [Streptomyces massasporeus]|uniref:EF-hand domain-containing protein n=1 Tax=Streptomyces massasporeus TaxID=67324 RepID=UPI00331D497E
MDINQEKADEIFRRIDTDGDGEISRVEFLRHLRQAQGLSEESFEFFDRADRSGDDYLSREEYYRLVRKAVLSDDADPTLVALFR